MPASTQFRPSSAVLAGTLSCWCLVTFHDDVQYVTLLQALHEYSTPVELDSHDFLQFAASFPGMVNFPWSFPCNRCLTPGFKLCPLQRTWHIPVTGAACCASLRTLVSYRQPMIAVASWVKPPTIEKTGEHPNSWTVIWA